MPISRAESDAEAIAAADKQKAHDAWAAQCDALGHPPTDENGDPIPDPLDQ